MRATIPAALARSLLLGATPVAARDGEPFWTDIANSTEFFEPIDEGQAPESTAEEDGEADAG